MIESIQLNDNFMIDTQIDCSTLWFLYLISYEREQWVLELIPISG